VDREGRTTAEKRKLEGITVPPEIVIDGEYELEDEDRAALLRGSGVQVFMLRAVSSPDRAKIKGVIGKRRDEQPLVNVVVEDIRMVIALFDSGASHCIVALDFLKLLWNDMALYKHGEIRFFEGPTLEAEVASGQTMNSIAQVELCVYAVATCSTRIRTKFRFCVLVCLINMPSYY
jgi:hypothetical protein